MVEFISQNTITPEGERVLAHIKTQLREADERGDRTYTSLSGPYRYFFANVVSLKAFSEAEFLKSYPNMAGAVYRDLVDLDEAKAQTEAAAAEKTVISESLDEVKAALAVALQRIADLEAAQQKPADEPTPEPEAEAAPVESKKAKKPAKTEPEPEAVEVETETEA